jgi:GTP 3',8-cyclase
MTAVCRDAFGRVIDYLRLSVTDRCNLRCVYCAPSQRVPQRPRHEILRYEEIVRVVEAAVGLGLRKIRLTGGEPLIRADLCSLIGRLSKIPGILEISLTTNGVLLEGLAEALSEAGLARVNVSLDTLQPARFDRITRGGRIDQVWRGIEAAERAGLVPVKLNMVAIRGLNDDELEAFARLTLTHPWNVRFIELMPIANEGDWGADFPGASRRFMAVSEMRERLAPLGRLLPADVPRGNGPAQIGRLPNAVGTVGFISSISQHFCAECNRLRLTADGWLRPCLLQEGEVNLMQVLRDNADVQRIQALITSAILAKPKRHRVPEHEMLPCRGMTTIGG